MKSFVVALVVALSLTAVPACGKSGPKLPTTSQVESVQVRAVKYAQAALTRVGELQTAAIAANRAGGLADHPAVIVVQFCVAAEKVLRDAPTSWYDSVAALYTKLQTDLTALDKQKLSTLLTALDAVLSSVSGGARP